MVAEPRTIELPGLDCGLCGYRTCKSLADKLPDQPELINRCVMLLKERERSKAEVEAQVQAAAVKRAKEAQTVCGACAAAPAPMFVWENEPADWRDSLGRNFDFFLEHLPEDPGPREVCRPHNPMLTRELNIQVGDVMIGRPLGMSCGCPVTHCGVVIDVDHRTGVIVWCVTGPLRPRQEGFKDIGYYSAEAYEGIVTRTNVELRIGQRYFFQPRMCMLQWRHSGLINFIQNTSEGTRIRLEGLFIG